MTDNLAWVRSWRTGRAWATNLALCGLGLALVLLAKQFVAEQTHYWMGFSGCSGWSAWVYVAAVLVVLTQPTDKRTVWIVLGFGVAAQMMTLFTDPFLSSDIYRYVWDGIVQHAHVNPYRYVPGNAALAWLRAPNQDVYDGINRRDYAVTIYPPCAQMLYWLVTWFSPSVQAMKAAMFGFECLTAAVLLALLKRLGRPAAQVLLFAWCPLLVWEIGGSGHLDAAVFALVALALLARCDGKPGLTGLYLGLAVMTKFYPLVLLPALWMRRPGKLGEWKLVAALVAPVVVGYAAYASVGMKVFGFLGGYAQEEGIKGGSRFFALDLVRSWPGLAWMPDVAFYVFAAAVLGALSWWGWKWAAVEWDVSASDRSAGTPREDGVPSFLRVAMLLAFAMMLLFSPHYPWYVVWLIPFFALVPDLTLLTYLMMFFYMFTTSLADGSAPKMFVLNKISYGVVLAAFALEFLVRRSWGWGKLFRVE